MTPRQPSLHAYLEALKARLGAGFALVATSDGLLLDGAGAPAEQLEVLAAHAPSQLPEAVRSAAGVAARRLEVAGERLYLAADVTPPADAALAVAAMLER
jgi:hypothetical protein